MNKDGTPVFANYNLFDRLVHEMRETQSVAASCAWCDWSMDGSLCETRAAFTLHREEQHPLVRAVLPNPRAKNITYAMRAAA